MNLYTEYSSFLERYFKGKVQKLPIDVISTCPNRDGSLGYGGCIYCRNDSFSPDFAKRLLPVTQQIERGKAFFSRKYTKMNYLAYFQSFTSTYADENRFINMCKDALDAEGIVGLVISTRPDCLPENILEHIADIRDKYQTVVIFELGAETAHNETLALLNRCHTWEQTVDAAWRLDSYGFPVGLHLMLGLPGEDIDKMVETVRLVNDLPVSTVKFHQLQILRGTPLEKMVSSGAIALKIFSPKEYATLCACLVRELRRDIAIERFVAQSPSKLLVAPRWGIKKEDLKRMIISELLR